jgi:antitoxin component of RelBE/YafQ-DinJ toxin-antitoxin module
MGTATLPKRIQHPATIRFTDEQRQAGERVAQELGVSFSDVVRLALLQYTRKNNTTSEALSK